MQENDEEKSTPSTISQLIVTGISVSQVDEIIHQKKENWRIRFKINNTQKIINS